MAGPAKAGPPPTGLYLANSFRLGLADGWQDTTLHIISGPLDDDLQHGVLVDREPDVDVDSVPDYADRQVQALEQSLNSCRVLLSEPMTLDSGLPAHRAVFVWWPTPERRVYQEQVYVLHEGSAYKLTASFTKKTRKTLGPQVERMMRSFCPGSPLNGR